MSRMVLNCYLLYKEHQQGKIPTKYDFTANIIDDLSQGWLGQWNNVRPNIGGGDGNQTENGIDQLPGKAK